MELLALMFMLTATFCWAMSQIIGKIALRNISANFFNAIRFSIVTPILLMTAFFTKSLYQLELNKPLAAAIFSGLLGTFCGCQLYYYSLKREAAHRIIPAGNSYPFWTIFLASLLLGEEVKMVLPISAVLIFLGSSLLVSRKKELKHWRMGTLIALLAAFLWGLNQVLYKYCITGGIEVLNLLAITTTTGAIFFGGVEVGSHQRSMRNLRSSVGLSALSGMIGFLVGELIFLFALRIEKASTLAPITGATIFFGFLLSVLLLKERPTKKSILGTIFIISGIVLIAI